jgi:hypothetical protein
MLTDASINSAQSCLLPPVWVISLQLPSQGFVVGCLVRVLRVQNDVRLLVAQAVGACRLGAGHAAGIQKTGPDEHP